MTPQRAIEIALIVIGAWFVAACVLGSMLAIAIYCQRRRRPRNKEQA